MPELELEGGRKLLYEGSVNSEREVRTQRRFWGRLLDIVAGEPAYRALIAPYSVVTDSQGRIIVSDPGAAGVHIFDFTHHRYKFIERKGKRRDSMIRPQCVAVDAQDLVSQIGQAGGGHTAHISEPEDGHARWGAWIAHAVEYPMNYKGPAQGLNSSV